MKQAGWVSQCVCLESGRKRLCKWIGELQRFIGLQVGMDLDGRITVEQAALHAGDQFDRVLFGGVSISRSANRPGRGVCVCAFHDTWRRGRRREHSNRFRRYAAAGSTARRSMPRIASRAAVAASAPFLKRDCAIELTGQLIERRAGR